MNTPLNDMEEKKLYLTFEKEYRTRRIPIHGKKYKDGDSLYEEYEETIPVGVLMSSDNTELARIYAYCDESWEVENVYGHHSCSFVPVEQIKWNDPWSRIIAHTILDFPFEQMTKLHDFLICKTLEFTDSRQDVLAGEITYDPSDFLCFVFTPTSFVTKEGDNINKDESGKLPFVLNVFIYVIAPAIIVAMLYHYYASGN